MPGIACCCATDVAGAATDMPAAMPLLLQLTCLLQLHAFNLYLYTNLTLCKYTTVGAPLLIFFLFFLIFFSRVPRALNLARIARRLWNHSTFRDPETRLPATTDFSPRPPIPVIYLYYAYVSIRQHTSAFVSIRQHSSAFVSIRQTTCPQLHVRLSQYYRP
jgi:hypothetical protein